MADCTDPSRLANMTLLSTKRTGWTHPHWRRHGLRKREVNIHSLDFIGVIEVNLTHAQGFSTVQHITGRANATLLAQNAKMNTSTVEHLVRQLTWLVTLSGCSLGD